MFWGTDAIDFLKDFLAHPELFVTDEMKRIDALPVAAARRN